MWLVFCVRATRGAGKRQRQKLHRAACRANVSPIPLTPAIGALAPTQPIGHNCIEVKSNISIQSARYYCSRRFVSDFPRAFHLTWHPSLRGDERMSNGMHSECDPVLHSNLAHQLGYVRLDRALPDAQWGADFLVRAPFHQHL